MDDRTSRPWALYFHGGSTTLGSPGNVDRYKLLRDAGFNVLAMEFRGYGGAPAEPRPSEDVLYSDARSTWDYLTKQRNVEASRVILFAWSLGSGVATQLATEVEPAALVTEGAFSALPEIGAALYPWLPVRLLMRNRFDNLSRASRVSPEWIVLHGRTDVEVPPSHAEVLAEAAPNARVIWLTAGHDDAPSADPVTVLSALREVARKVDDAAPPLARTSG